MNLNEIVELENRLCTKVIPSRYALGPFSQDFQSDPFGSARDTVNEKRGSAFFYKLQAFSFCKYTLSETLNETLNETFNETLNAALF